MPAPATNLTLPTSTSASTPATTPTDEPSTVEPANVPTSVTTIDVTPTTTVVVPTTPPTEAAVVAPPVPAPVVPVHTEVPKAPIIKITTPVPPPVAVPAAQTFANCTALRAVYPHGVGMSGAVDHVTSGKPVTTFTRSASLYEANAGSDRDGDQIACEQQ